MDIIVKSNLKNIVLDATMLTNIMKCGELTKLKHKEHLQPISGTGNSLEVGSIVHKFLEIYYKSQKQGVSRGQALGFGMSAAELYIQGCPHCTNFVPTHDKGDTLGDKPCIIKPVCGHQPNEYPGLHNTPAESEGYVIGWKWALTTCEQYAEFWKNDFWVTVDTEVVKSKVLYEDDECRILFKSKLDWIVDTNEAILPSDHKTMKQNRPSLLLNNQFMGQCRQLDVNKVIINKIGFQKTLKPAEKFVREQLTYLDEQLFEWQSQVLPYWAKQLVVWEEENFFPRNFSNCETKFGKCEFYNVCSVPPNMRQDELRNNFVVGPEWNPTNADE